jgi:hypothetical protein
MSKSHGKRHKKGSTVAAIPPISSLRPRLDALWNSTALPDQDQSATYADLDAVIQGVKPALFLPTMLRAYTAAPAEAQARLDEVLPLWLRDRDYVATIEDLVAQGMLDGALQQQAIQWIASTGHDPLAALTEWNSFFRADFSGDDSQAALILLWYTSRNQHRVQGFNFLIDYNPPWDGSIKDIMLYPQRSPQAAITQFVDGWRARVPVPMRQIDAVEAKQKIIEALARNDEAKIRLPEDLITSREAFVQHVLTLPDGPQTSSFTLEDFDFLCRNGERPEAITRYEQTVGRRVRMPDGKELLVMGGDLDWDE